jgi:starch synthase
LAPVAATEQEIKRLSLKYPDKFTASWPSMLILLKKVYAGSDIFLMPSKFEPCGLGQMIAMRYGTVPVVRSTGGLKDTVKDYSAATHQGTGFVFAGYTSQELLAAIERALDLYQEPKKWHTIISRIMHEDFSWHSSAEQYLRLYQKLLEK